jgi:hypothetical protein
MKKILFTCLIMGLAFITKAQNPTFSPAIFTAEDEVTFTVDVSGTPMAGEADAYLWMWGSAGDSPLNTAWSNSPDAAKLTNVGGNKWSFKFTATLLWGRPPSDLTTFSFLVKTKTGSKQTSNFEGFTFDPLVFTPTVLRVFPTKASAKDIITVNFDRTLGSTVNEQRMTPQTATITAFDETSTQIGTALTIPVRLLQTNIWAVTFDPKSRFTPAAGHTLKKFTYKFNGTVLGPTGAPVNVSSSETTYDFSNLN